MELPLKDVAPERFFAILPSDWQEEIMSAWPDCHTYARVLGVNLDGSIIGGGIVFSQPSPDVAPYADDAKALFNKGYLYIGFLWVDPAHREKGYGTRIMRQIMKTYPRKHFWISIEDPSLSAFYEKLGFRFLKIVHGADKPEWIYTLESND